MDGILLVNKNIGWTSHDVVNFTRKRFKLQKVGHAGTLDPGAEGLLVLLLGKATKLFVKLSKHDKEYTAIVKLGESTDTLDKEGNIVDKLDNISVTPQQVRNVLKDLQGKVSQIPPMFSAVRVNGKRLYEFAREGKKIYRKAREVDIYDIKMGHFKLPFIKIHIKCSKGTYTRTICSELGKKLSIPAHQFALIREKCGNFKLEDAIEMDELKKISKLELKSKIIPINKLKL